ncbi:MAG: RsmE family RNA methyltransferase [bacterium]|nr:RsmE family RNA methyltransferase [bacterium]
MAYFKTDNPITKGETVALVGPEHHHAKDVRRIFVGESVHILNNKTIAEGIVEAIEGERTIVRVLHIFPQEQIHDISLVVGVVKRQALEEIVRHATELGVAKLVLFHADHSPLSFPEIPERLIRIAEEACKQADRPTPPSIVLASSLEEILTEQSAGSIIVGSKYAPKTVSTPLAEPILLVVGPEGGLSKREEELLRNARAQHVTLSAFTLRTPTAALALLSFANSLLK